MVLIYGDSKRRRKKEDTNGTRVGAGLKRDLPGDFGNREQRPPFCGKRDQWQF